MAARRRKPAPGAMTTAVSGALDAMPWLTPADQALVGLAMLYAEQIDAAIAESPEAGRKHAGWVGSHLTNVLRSLGGAPGDRKALEIDGNVKGRLAELRQRRAG